MSVEDDPSKQPLQPAGPEGRTGLICGLSAYTLWGVFPLYFRALAHVSPFTILCHRVVWSAVFLAVVITLRKEWQGVRGLLRPGRRLGLLAVGSVLVALNWLIFIYAVGSRQTLQASLGYFINPLLSVALGMIFLRERLRPWQWLAVLMACLAIANLALRGTGLPWIAVSLAATFGFYGLVRKKLDLNSLHALLLETSLLFPAALVLLKIQPVGAARAIDWVLLLLLGVVTAVPLLLFGAAVRRLRLSTVGFLQYVGPTLQFLVATWILHEPLDQTKLVSFALCWVAIAIYVVDSLRRSSPPAIPDEPD